MDGDTRITLMFSYHDVRQSIPSNTGKLSQSIGAGMVIGSDILTNITSNDTSQRYPLLKLDLSSIMDHTCLSIHRFNVMCTIHEDGTTSFNLSVTQDTYRTNTVFASVIKTHEAPATRNHARRQLRYLEQKHIISQIRRIFGLSPMHIINTKYVTGKCIITIRIDPVIENGKPRYDIRTCNMSSMLIPLNDGRRQIGMVSILTQLQCERKDDHVLIAMTYPTIPLEHITSKLSLMLVDTKEIDQNVTATVSASKGIYQFVIM